MNRTMISVKGMLLAMVLANSILALSVGGQSGAPANTHPAAGTPFRNQPPRIANRARAYYGLFWGVGSLSVKAVESGEIIRFSYYVLDPQKAKMLNDKTLEPSLIAPEKGVRLVVPALEQVGVLRQTSTPEAGRSYWMGFSNPDRSVRPGDHISVQIGQFRADGLIVE
jgi:hypothetical protein